MKVAGIVLTIVGGLLILGGLNTAFTQYDFHSSHDVSKFLGGLAVGALILIGGVSLIKRTGSRR